MAASTQGALIGTLRAEEENGVTVALELRYLVRGLTESGTAKVDEAMSASGVPTAGSTLVGHTELAAISRRYEAIPGNETQAYVDITFKRYGRDDSLAGASGFRWNVRLTGGLQQVETYNDVDGAEVLVSHTWPADDPDYGGLTLTQGVAIPVTEAQPVIEITGQMPVDYPLVIKGSWENYLNADFWAGLPPRSWLCQAFDFTLSDPSTSPWTWEFTAQFQANRNTWDQIAYYTDPRTGKPPANLVLGTGIVRPYTYYTRPFGQLFNL